MNIVSSTIKGTSANDRTGFRSVLCLHETRWIVHRLSIVFGMWSTITAIESPQSRFCMEYRPIECIPVLETWHHSGTLRGVYKQTIWSGKSNKLIKMHSLLNLCHDNTFWQTKYIHPQSNKFWTNKNEDCMRHNPQHTSDSFRFHWLLESTNRQHQHFTMISLRRRALFKGSRKHFVSGLKIFVGSWRRTLNQRSFQWVFGYSRWAGARLDGHLDLNKTNEWKFKLVFVLFSSTRNEFILMNDDWDDRTQSQWMVIDTHNYRS